MKTIGLIEEAKVRGRVNKASLADRYLVGCRTIENWQARGIIVGQLVGNKWMFDARNCDKRLFLHSNQNKSQ